MPSTIPRLGDKHPTGLVPVAGALVVASVLALASTFGAGGGAGAAEPGTPTPTSTAPAQQLDIEHATPGSCGATYSGDTRTGAANVSRYACRPAWLEDGPEVVYRIDLAQGQPLTASLLAPASDLDLFLLHDASPDSCIASGDSFLQYDATPGTYYLAVDGSAAASGPFALRLDCPFGPTPTATPRPSPTSTPTASATVAPGLTPTPTSTRVRLSLYLPLGQRELPARPPKGATIVLRQGVDGYLGAADTTLDAWTPDKAYGDADGLRIFYSRNLKPNAQMAPVVRFDLGFLPEGAVVTDARFRLYLVDTPRYDLRATAHALLTSWDEPSATWIQRGTGQFWALPGAQGAGSDRSVWGSGERLLSEGRSWYEFDVTAFAAEWVREPSRNHGIVLLAGPGESQANVQAVFASSDEADTAKRPQLLVTYWIPVSAAGR